MRDRDYHHRKARKSGSAYHWHLFRKLRNFVNKEIKASKSKYYTNLIEESKGNASKIWNAVNEASYRKSQSAAPSCIISNEVQHTEPKAVAAALNEHFATIGQTLADRLSSFVTKVTPQRQSNETTSFRILPVDELFVASQLKSLKAKKATGLDKVSARLLKDVADEITPSITLQLNRPISSHTFPSTWKCAKVIALFKSGDKESATNYRPISLLPTLNKLLERAVYTQLYEYLARNKILNEKQFGFRPKCSTTTSLTNFADEILAKMENGQLCGAVFLDLSKAFNHSILLTKLSAVGVCHEDLTWFESYLSSWTLRTACGQELSDPLPCNIDVPQGNILGPLLFIVYINDLPDVVKHTQVSLYADDTVLYCFLDPIDLEEQLNADLHTVCDWLRDNKLTLNIKKTKAVVIGSNQKLSNTSSVTVHVNGNTIENVEHTLNNNDLE